MRKLTPFGSALVLVASIAACGSTQSDADQVASLATKVKADMKAGNVSALAGLMNPACSGEFLGNVAMAKAFGIDLGEYMKSVSSDMTNKTADLVVQGTNAYAKKDLSTVLAIKVDGKWYMDCSDSTSNPSV